MKYMLSTNYNTQNKRTKSKNKYGMIINDSIAPSQTRKLRGMGTLKQCYKNCVLGRLFFPSQHLLCTPYRGYGSVIEDSFAEKWDDPLSKLFDSATTESSSNAKENSRFMLLCIKNAGCVGIGRLREQLFSMRTMEAMVGLSLSFS